MFSESVNEIGKSWLSQVQPAEIFGLDRLLETAATLSANEESIPENIAVDLQEQEKQLCQKDPKVITLFPVIFLSSSIYADVLCVSCPHTLLNC